MDNTNSLDFFVAPKKLYQALAGCDKKIHALNVRAQSLVVRSSILSSGLVPGRIVPAGVSILDILFEDAGCA